MTVIESIAEYIYLHWDSDPPYEVVRGHVGEADARNIVAWEGAVDEDYPYTTIEQTYGRWVPNHTGEYGMRFHVANKPGRGAFPVTLLWYD